MRRSENGIAAWHSLAILVLLLACAGSRAMACDQPVWLEYHTADFGWTTGWVEVNDPNNCGWTVKTSVPWIINVRPSSGTGNHRVDYDVVPDGGPRAGILQAGNHYFALFQRFNSSSYCNDRHISSWNAQFGRGGGSQDIRVDPDAFGCGWGVDNLPSWITYKITSTSPDHSIRTGGIVTLTAAANAGAAARAWPVIVANSVVLVYQAGAPAPCPTPTVSSPTGTIAADGTGYQDVAVTAGAGCGWTASGSGWAQVSSTSGTGNGSVRVTASSANTSTTARSVNVTVAGQSVQVTQAGKPCAYSVTPSSAMLAADGKNYVDLTVTTEAGCAWQAAGSGWAQVSPTSGTGSGSVRVTATSANTLTAARSVNVTVAGHSVQVTQAGKACTYTVTPPVGTIAADATNYVEVTVDTDAGCVWHATGSDWAQVSPASASGSGRVRVTANSPNTATSTRSVNITVAGKSVQVTQAAACGAPVVSPTTVDLVWDGTGSANVKVTTNPGCGWTTQGNSWATVGPATGPGSGSAAISASSNSATSPRSVNVTVAGQTVKVTQAGKPACWPSVSSPSGNIPADATRAVDVVVTIPNGCAWTAAGSGWAAVDPTSGTGPGTVHVRATSANPPSTSRSTTVTIAGQPVSVTQDGTPLPQFTLTPAYANIAAEGGPLRVAVATVATQSWKAASGSSWIVMDLTVSGTGAGAISLHVLANSGAARTGTVKFTNPAGEVLNSFKVDQARPDCTSIPVSPTSLIVPAAGGNPTVAVMAPAGCPWTANSPSTWVTVAMGSSVTGPGIVTLAVKANTSSTASTAQLTIAGRTVTVTREGKTSIRSMAERAPAHPREPLQPDLDGDGKSDLAVFRPTEALWILLPSSGWCPAGFNYADFTPDGQPLCQRQFGLPGDVPAAADYDGDGRIDLAVWRAAQQALEMEPSSGVCPEGWGSAPGSSSVVCRREIAAAGMVPAPADYDGDGLADVAFFAPDKGLWLVFPSSRETPAGFEAAADGAVTMAGVPAGVPVPGDYDGDGLADVAAVRLTDLVMWMRPSSGACPAEFQGVQSEDGRQACTRHLESVDAVARADYDDDRLPDVMQWSAAEGIWQLTPSSRACPSYLLYAGMSAQGSAICRRQFGAPGDVPVR